MPRRGTSGSDLPTMSFLEHLEELRNRILRSVYATAAAFALCLTYSRNIMEFMLRPIRPFLGENKPVFLDLTEPFMLYMKVAFLAALFLASPLVLYQIWAFIRPGLYPRERRYAVPFVLFATFFFALGGWFGYSVAFPTACRFLLSVVEGFTPALRVTSLFAFESKMILGMGLVFELPTVVYFLSCLGVFYVGFICQNFMITIL